MKAGAHSFKVVEDFDIIEIPFLGQKGQTLL